MSASSQMPAAEVIYWSFAATMAVGFVLTLVLYTADARTIDGVQSVWTKPLKFELSLALHAATLAIVSALLSDAWRRSAGVLVLAIVFFAACIVEMGYIVMQAARAEHSHFNVGTPFHSFMYQVMATMAVVIVGTAGVLGLIVAADQNAATTPVLRMGIVIAFVGGCVLTLITAFTIGARMSPFVSEAPAAGEMMRWTGWSLRSGDLRVSHFLSTHMMQAVPLVGVLLDRLAAAGPARIGTLTCAAAWVAWTLFEYRTALGGKFSPVVRALAAAGL